MPEDSREMDLPRGTQALVWLHRALARCPLTEEVEGYLLGRGTKPDTIQTTGLVTWIKPEEECPDAEFCREYGPRGEKFEGHLVCPLHSPRGGLLGIEVRSIEVKRISRYLVPEAAWQPIFFGMRKAMPKIWARGDVWLAEGQFDIYPLEWIVPESDAVLGTGRAALTPKQLEFLRRLHPPLIHTVFDMDETGRNATFGYTDAKTGKFRMGIPERLRRIGLRAQEHLYAGGKDPGVIWDTGGVEALRTAFPL